MARETQGSPASEKKLEQYGVWVKVKPRDVTTAPALEESFELSDLEAPKAQGRSQAVVEESALTAEEEKLLDDLETELEPAVELGDAESLGISVPEEEPLLAETELPDIDTAASGETELGLESVDEELPELEEDLEPAPRAERASVAARSSEPETAEVEVTLSDDGGEEDHFDDLAALESELASVTTKTRDTSSAASAEILARIEDELKSIRTDLTQLRRDLSGLRKSAADAGAEGPSSSAGSQGGYFDEDEDESIALTGDELDNILNTAEITEEAAEAPGAAADMDPLGTSEPAADGAADILGYETPAPEPVEAPVQEEDLEILEEPMSDETLVLTDDELLPTDDIGDTARTVAAEELPADLVLEELDMEDETPAEPSADSGAGMPEIDLEGIPEAEAEPVIAPAPKIESAMDDEGSETIDLETLDLGEEPMVIDAVPEQVEELEEFEDAEEILEAESLPPETSKSPSHPSDDVDLEALAAEAEELEDGVTVSPVVEDLEIGELETLAEETGPSEAPQDEIEISFESDLAEDVEALQAAAEPGTPDEEVAEAEEVTEAPVSGAPASAGIPDNLKDEIRTVLKYMDHLLEALPDEKIQEFAGSDYFVMYKKLFEDLGLGE
jgi:hypothetical protein